MPRRVRIEEDPLAEEEIVIRCRRITSEILCLQRMAERDFLPQRREMSLTIGDAEYFVPLDEILFFESTPKGTAAHTAGRMYRTERTLGGLCNDLPPDFMRISKSAVVNLRRIESLRREMTGIAEAAFSGCAKSVYISRMYYKPFRERLLELRLNDRNTENKQKKEN